MFPKVVSIILAFCLLPFSQTYGAEQVLALPTPGTMVHLSPALNPPVLKGIKVDTKNPFKFEFVLSQGDKTSDEAKDESTLAKADYLKKESTKLIKYFLAAITTPEKDLWVNLSPYEKDRIVPESFGQTEMGRDLLAQDYLLKQLTASLIYPEDEIGKKFWKRVYEQTANKDIPINTFNKVWIVPNKAVVYENTKNGTAYVVESSLKVLTEQDYLAVDKNMSSPKSLPAAVPAGRQGRQGFIGDPQKIIRDIVIPELTKDVNEGTNFAQLRQVYNSLILATWYKKKIKDSILAQVYADKNKVKGLEHQSLDVNAIYTQYLESFKKGTYNFIKEEQDPISKQIIPRKYFSGGFTAASMAMTTMEEITNSSLKNKQAMIVTVSMDSAMQGNESQLFETLRTHSFDVVQNSGFLTKELIRGLDDEELKKYLDKVGQAGFATVEYLAQFSFGTSVTNFVYDDLMALEPNIRAWIAAYQKDKRFSKKNKSNDGINALITALQYLRDNPQQMSYHIERKEGERITFIRRLMDLIMSADNFGVLSYKTLGNGVTISAISKDGITQTIQYLDDLRKGLEQVGQYINDEIYVSKVYAYYKEKILSAPQEVYEDFFRFNKRIFDDRPYASLGALYRIWDEGNSEIKRRIIYLLLKVTLSEGSLAIPSEEEKLQDALHGFIELIPEQSEFYQKINPKLKIPKEDKRKRESRHRKFSQAMTANGQKQMFVENKGAILRAFLKEAQGIIEATDLVDLKKKQVAQQLSGVAQSFMALRSRSAQMMLKELEESGPQQFKEFWQKLSEQPSFHKPGVQEAVHEYLVGFLLVEQMLSKKTDEKKDIYQFEFSIWQKYMLRPEFYDAILLATGMNEQKALDIHEKFLAYAFFVMDGLKDRLLDRQHLRLPIYKPMYDQVQAWFAQSIQQFYWDKVFMRNQRHRAMFLREPAKTPTQSPGIHLAKKNPRELGISPKRLLATAEQSNHQLPSKTPQVSELKIPFFILEYPHYLDIDFLNLHLNVLSNMRQAFEIAVRDNHPPQGFEEYRAIKGIYRSIPNGEIDPNHSAYIRYFAGDKPALVLVGIGPRRLFHERSANRLHLKDMFERYLISISGDNVHTLEEFMQQNPGKVKKFDLAQTAMERAPVFDIRKLIKGDVEKAIVSLHAKRGVLEIKRIKDKAMKVDLERRGLMALGLATMSGAVTDAISQTKANKAKVILVGVDHHSVDEDFSLDDTYAFLSRRKVQNDLTPEIMKVARDNFNRQIAFLNHPTRQKYLKSRKEAMEYLRGLSAKGVVDFGIERHAHEIETMFSRFDRLQKLREELKKLNFVISDKQWTDITTYIFDLAFLLKYAFGKNINLVGVDINDKREIFEALRTAQIRSAALRTVIYSNKKASSVFEEFIKFSNKLDRSLTEEEKRKWRERFEISLRGSLSVDYEQLKWMFGQLVDVVSDYKRQAQDVRNAYINKRAHFEMEGKKPDSPPFVIHLGFKHIQKLKGLLEKDFDVEVKIFADSAMLIIRNKSAIAGQPGRITTPGGIDLQADKVNLDLKSDSSGGIQFKTDPAMLEKFRNTLGFIPVIVGIRALPAGDAGIRDLKRFLGVPL